MELALPIVIGVLTGIVCGAPYAIATAISKRKRNGSLIPLLVAVCASFVVIALSILIAYAVARDVLLEFAIALMVTFLVIVIVTVIVFNRRPRQ